MDKAEVKQIVTLWNDIQEDICEGEVSAVHLTDLHRVIRFLMDEAFEAQDQELRVLLASLAYRARRRKRTIEERLGMRN